MIAHRREMPDDPIIYAFRDGASRTTVAAMVCIMLAAIPVLSPSGACAGPRQWIHRGHPISL